MGKREFKQDPVLNESVGCVLSDERECKQDNND
jgi:hypothetical protein